MSWLKRHDVAVFLVLAFALAWWPGPFAVTNPNPNTAVMIPWSPITAALIVLWLTQGRRGVASLLRAIVRWRYGVRWYLLASLAPLGVALAVVYLNDALGAPAPKLPALGDLPPILVSFVFLLLVQGPLTEEPGWRGFLLPRLVTNRTPLAASLIVGIIWATWHLPLLISDPSAQRPPVQYFISVVSMSIVLSWLYLATRGSLLLPILMHAATNTFAAVLIGGVSSEYYARVWWLYAAIWAIFALVVTRSKVMAPARVAEPLEAVAN